MIISRFNKYVEKHGRVTYIVLGIIICFMFVIFVTPDVGGGCSRSYGRVTSIGSMYGHKIKVNDFRKMRIETDIACFIKYNMLLSQYNEEFLNRETFNRMRLIHEAKKRGYIKAVKDEEVAKKIQDLRWLQDKDGNFDTVKFKNFKEGFLNSNGLAASEFDDIIRHSIAIDKMTEDITKGITVTQAEVDAELRQYTLKHAEISLNTNKDALPSDAEINDFFAKRKAEIKPESIRQAAVATITVAALNSKLAATNPPDDLKKAAEVTEADARKQFDSLKDRLYKGKDFNKEKASIIASMRTTRIRNYARKQAAELITKISAETEKLDAKAAVTKFRELAAKAGATISDTGKFDEGNNFPGMKGTHRQLANAIRALDKPGAITNTPVSDAGGFVFAILIDKQPGKLPEKVTDSLKAKISTLILNEKALAFYNEKIAPFKAMAAGTRSAWEMGRAHMQKLRDDNSLTDEQKTLEVAKYGDFVRECVQPFYRSEKRSFSLLTFKPGDYKAKVTVTEDDIQKKFEERKAEYEKIDARISQVVVSVSPDDKDEIKKAKKAKIDAAYAKLINGTDISSIAKEYSEDAATASKGGDTGLVDTSTFDPAVKAQIEKMQENQLSSVITTAKGYVFFKLVTKTSPKTLADVKAEIVALLTDEGAKKAAMADAEKASQAVATAWQESGHKTAERIDILKNNAQFATANLTAIPAAQQYNYGAAGPVADNALMRAVFQTSIEEPYTGPVEGTDAAYVACLDTVTPAFIEDGANRMSALLNVYKRQVADAAAKARANNEVTRINEALKKDPDLKKAAGDVVFKDVTETLTKKNASSFKGFTVRDKTTLLSVVAKAAPKSVAAPVRSYSGYELVFVEKAELPQGDDAAKDRESTREQLVNQKKQKVLSDFFQKIEKESDTKDIIPGLLGNQNT